MWRNLSLNLLCGAACAAAWSAPALAGTLQVNPVLVEIGTDRRTATVTVRNQESVPVTIRAYPLAWRQADGEDLYDETMAIIVSPPVATIAPGAAQLVRVGLRQPSSTGQAYRLVIEEVPEAAPGGGVKVALRLNLPLYAMMPAGEASRLRWSAQPRPRGGWLVEAANPGPGYVRLGGAEARAATGLAFDEGLGFGTVLPGAVRRWPIDGDVRVADPARLRLIQRAAADVATPQGSE